MVTKKPKIAIITSPQVGKPDVKRLSKVAALSYSDDVGLEEALHGARAALLWDVGLMDVLRENWRLTKDLEWLHVAVTGVDEICFEEIRASDIVLTNAGGVYNYAIAEHVTGAIIAYERNYPRLYYQKRRKQWRPFVSGSAQGKNALIIGPGRIGRACARSPSTLGMHVRGIGRHHAADDPDFECIEPVERIDELVGWAHHLIVCAPLTDETYHLLDADLFKHCRSTVHVINVGRGPIIDTPDLIAALQQGEIGGASIDVFEKEPLDPASPLWGMSVVMITPHIAGEIAGFEGALTDQFVNNALRWIRHEPLEYVVDKERGY